MVATNHTHDPAARSWVAGAEPARRRLPDPESPFRGVSTPRRAAASLAGRCRNRRSRRRRYAVVSDIARSRRKGASRLVWQCRQGRYANVPYNYPAGGGVQIHHEAAMIDSFTVEHHEHLSHRSFEDVVAAFEAELGSVEDGAIPREVAA